MNDFLIHTNLLITTIINLLYGCKKVFILRNIAMIGKTSMKTSSSLFKELHFFLPELFEIFRNMCHKIYELDLAKLLSVLGLAWQAA